jgi:hypothetical protein
MDTESLDRPNHDGEEMLTILEVAHIALKMTNLREHIISDELDINNEELVKLRDRLSIFLDSEPKMQYRLLEQGEIQRKGDLEWRARVMEWMPIDRDDVGKPLNHYIPVKRLI